MQFCWELAVEYPASFPAECRPPKMEPDSSAAGKEKAASPAGSLQGAKGWGWGARVDLHFCHLLAL